MNPEYLPDIVERTAAFYGMDLTQSLALVSGGPDSVALLRVLVELGHWPVVLHVDHGLRGAESRADAEFVEELCGTLGLDYEVRLLDFQSASNVQEEARRARYRSADEVVEARGLSGVVTGHTADDVAETVLMNLARGAGMRGISGIPPVSGKVVRPLIRCRRTDVLGYLELLGQPYRTDRTNLTGKYARNRVRLEALPVLEELYPGAGSNIARGALLLQEDLRVLEDLAAKALRYREHEVYIPFDDLDSLPVPLRRHAIRRAYAALLPDASGLDAAAVEAVLDIAANGRGTRLLDLPGNIVAAGRTTGELAFYPREIQDGAAGKEPVRVRPGRWRFGGWTVEVQEVVGFDAADAARPEVAYLDDARGPYQVQMVREGDTVRPLGLGGEKKVLRAMMDRKVPKDLRRRTPVVVDEEERVAWVFMGELGEEFKVGDGARAAVRIAVEENREDV